MDHITEQPHIYGHPLAKRVPEQGAMELSGEWYSDWRYKEPTQMPQLTDDINTATYTPWNTPWTKPDLTHIAPPKAPPRSLGAIGAKKPAKKQGKTPPPDRVCKWGDKCRLIGTCPFGHPTARVEPTPPELPAVVPEPLMTVREARTIDKEAATLPILEEATEINDALKGYVDSLPKHEKPNNNDLRILRNAHVVGCDLDKREKYYSSFVSLAASLLPWGRISRPDAVKITVTTQLETNAYRLQLSEFEATQIRKRQKCGKVSESDDAAQRVEHIIDVSDADEDAKSVLRSYYEHLKEKANFALAPIAVGSRLTTVAFSLARYLNMFFYVGTICGILMKMVFLFLCWFNNWGYLNMEIFVAIVASTILGTFVTSWVVSSLSPDRLYYYRTHEKQIDSGWELPRLDGYGPTRLQGMKWLDNVAAASEDLDVPIGLMRYLASTITSCATMAAGYPRVQGLAKAWCEANKIDPRDACYFIVQVTRHLKLNAEEWAALKK